MKDTLGGEWIVKYPKYPVWPYSVKNGWIHKWKHIEFGCAFCIIPSFFNSNVPPPFIPILDFQGLIAELEREPEPEPKLGQFKLYSMKDSWIHKWTKLVFSA